jgi:hypothetical protein
MRECARGREPSVGAVGLEFPSKGEKVIAEFPSEFPSKGIRREFEARRVMKPLRVVSGKSCNILLVLRPYGAVSLFL